MGGSLCRWKWIEDHTERSAWIAAVVASVAMLISVGIAFWLKGYLARQEEAKAKDVEKGVDGEVKADGVPLLAY